MLYFVCFVRTGFFRKIKPNTRVFDAATTPTEVLFTYNIRLARPFTSFEAADDQGRALQDKHGPYAILSNCIG